MSKIPGMYESVSKKELRALRDTTAKLRQFRHITLAVIELAIVMGIGYILISALIG